MAMTLRQRNRLETMRRVQRKALEWFEAEGFDRVTVEDVAAATGVSSSTLYRYFGTKEGFVLWDENDAAIGDELERRLPVQPPLDAVRDAFVSVLGSQSDESGEGREGVSLLHRVRFIYATPQVHAAAVQQMIKDQGDLAAGLMQVMPSKDKDLRARVLAGACMTALDVAIDQWQEDNGRRPLEDLIRAAFAILEDPFARP